MNMKNSYLILAGVLALLFYACDDGSSLLDKEDVGDLFEGDVFRNYVYADQFLNDIYYNVPETGFAVTSDWNGAYLDCATDNGEARHLSSHAHRFNNGNLNGKQVPLGGIWSKGYAGIRACNKLLKYIHLVEPGAGKTELDVEYLRGQALFLRAVHYAYLAKAFGGVPIITDVLTMDDPVWTTIPRSTFEETIDFIVQECETAALVCEKYGPDELNGTTLGRANRGTALALKAKVLLMAASPLFNRPPHYSQYDNDAQMKYWRYEDYQKARWERAAKAAKDVIDLNKYDLYQQAEGTKNAYETYFTKRDNLPETIYPFLRGPGADVYYANLPFEFIYVRGKDKGNPMCYNLPTQELVDAYEMANGMFPDQPGSGFRPLNPFANRDPRLNATIWHDESTYTGIEFQTWRRETSSVKASGKHYITGYSRTGYFLRKYMDVDQNAASNEILLPNAYPIIRYADILLAYAESLNEFYDNPTQAPADGIRWAIDQVRGRAGMPGVDATFANRGWSLTQDNVRKLIMNERRVEFAFEEHRFWDVRRWMIGEETQRAVSELDIILKDDDKTKEYHVVKIESRAYTDRMNLMPIPDTEIIKNPNIVQNWGWTPAPVN